jgi:hypothetical protein
MSMTARPSTAKADTDARKETNNAGTNNNFFILNPLNCRYILYELR